MEAIPPVERIVSPQTAEVSRRFNAATEALAGAASKGKNHILAACQQTRDKLGPAALPVALTTAAVAALVLADRRRRSQRSSLDWRSLCSASMFIPIPTLRELCSDGAPIEITDDINEGWKTAHIGSVVGIIGEDPLVDEVFDLLFGSGASSRRGETSSGLEASICGGPLTTGIESSGQGQCKGFESAATYSQYNAMMMLRARGTINSPTSVDSVSPASATERAETYDCVREIVSSLADHIFFIVRSLTVDEQCALEKVLTQASRSNTQVTVLHLIPGCNNMDQLMSAFHGQLSSLYRNSVRDSSSGVCVRATPYKDYAFCACPLRGTMATSSPLVGSDSSGKQHQSVLTKHYALASKLESPEALRQIRNELLLLLRGATAFESSKCDADTEVVASSPIDVIKEGMQRTLVRYCAVVNPAEEDNADKATSPLNEAAEDTGEDGDVLTVDVVEVPDNEAPSWRETFCRKIGLIRKPRRDYEAKLLVRCPPGCAGKVVPVSQSLMVDEPSLIPRSCVYETLDRDGRTIIKHIDIEAPGISFDDVEVSVIKREWLSCLMTKPIPEDAESRFNFTENTIAYGSVHRWFWLGSPTSKARNGAAGDDAGIMYRPVPQPNGISLFNGILSIQLYRIDTSHVVKRRANRSVAGGSAVTSTTAGQSKHPDAANSATRRDPNSIDDESETKPIDDDGRVPISSTTGSGKIGFFG